MEDLHDIIMFPYNGEKILGLVVKHYDYPLGDFYIIYAEHALFEYHDDNDCYIIINDVVIPSADEAINDYKLKKQLIQNIADNNKIVSLLIEAIKSMNIEDILK